MGVPEVVAITINAVSHYVAGLVDGLQSPYFAPCRAIITNDIQLPEIPQSGDVGGAMLPVPMLFVWTPNSRKERQTAPRPIAYAKRTFEFRLLGIVVDNVDAPNRDSALHCLMDAVDIQLSTTPSPLTITDPDTSWSSQVLSIGERVTTEVLLPETIGDASGSYLRYGFGMVLVVEETQNYQPQPRI